eukprot:TRINITY_DN3799_c0_g1_i1.p2 TRINITY_DN3799_c0_g1~~TRINITY_DN3799_c0_g1_i1.p2  ORF type:complete len:267 (+),score=75.57 TRINITY_DN3799_c0_g1_i1:60-860(+)
MMRKEKKQSEGDGGSDSDCCSDDDKIHFYFDGKAGMQYFVDMTREQRSSCPDAFARIDQRARSKMKAGFRFQDVDALFDPAADDADAKWVSSRAPRRGGAHLSCPGCFATLCLHCSPCGSEEGNVWAAAEAVGCYADLSSPRPRPPELAGGRPLKRRRHSPAAAAAAVTQRPAAKSRPDTSTWDWSWLDGPVRSAAVRAAPPAVVAPPAAAAAAVAAALSAAAACCRFPDRGGWYRLHCSGCRAKVGWRGESEPFLYLTNAIPSEL